MVNIETTYRQAPSIVSRKIGDDFILVPIRQNMGDLESIYTLNDTAASIWAMMDGYHSLDQIRDHLLEEYEIDPAQAEQDLLELVDHLLKLSALEQV